MFGLPNTRYAAKGYIGDGEGTHAKVLVEAANADDLLVLWWLGHNWVNHVFDNTRIEVAYGTAPVTFTDILLAVTLEAAGGVIDMPFKHGLYDPSFRGSDMRVTWDWDTDPTELGDGRPHAVIS
jgi:hypothetical protein